MGADQKRSHDEAQAAPTARSAQVEVPLLETQGASLEADIVLADTARAAILLWELNPKRQSLAKMLGLPPGEVTDEMIARVERGPGNRGPNLQQIPLARRRDPGRRAS